MLRRITWSALVVALVAAVVVWGGACSLSLASRRAQVLQSGELELSAGASGGVLFSQASAGSFSSSYVPALGTNASVRFGLMPRVDMQLRLLDMLVPEVSAGWQLVGDPAANDFALTLTAGVGPQGSVGFSNATGAFGSYGAFIPLQLLVDVPVGDGALTFGARAVGAGSRFEGNDGGNDGGSFSFTLSPGLLASWTIPFGSWFARPEIAANLPLFGAAPLGNGAVVLGTLAFGYEFGL